MRISDWSSDVCSSDLAAEHEQMAREGIVPQRFLDLPGQAVEALAHVGLAGPQPHPDTARDRDHRWPSARSTCAIAVASTGGIKRTRMPSGIPISISQSLAAALEPQGSGSAAVSSSEIGRAIVRTPVTNAQNVLRLLLEKNNNTAT